MIDRMRGKQNVQSVTGVYLDEQQGIEKEIWTTEKRREAINVRNAQLVNIVDTLCLVLEEKLHG